VYTNNWVPAGLLLCSLVVRRISRIEGNKAVRQFSGFVMFYVTLQWIAGLMVE
jgi:hypothetical protein